jgi:hypothetical protein
MWQFFLFLFLNSGYWNPPNFLFGNFHFQFRQDRKGWNFLGIRVRGQTKRSLDCRVQGCDWVPFLSLFPDIGRLLVLASQASIYPSPMLCFFSGSNPAITNIKRKRLEADATCYCAASSPLFAFVCLLLC